MSKKFNIHEWQAKQRLIEGKGSTLSLSKSDMEKLHKDGKIEIDGHKILYKVEENLPEQTMTNFGPVRSVTKYNGLPIRDNVMDYANEILNQINDYENNVGPGEQMINYNATREAARALMNAVDKDEEGMMEISTTGTGASFQAGAGEAYATPYAFKKKRKDD
tara:strand:+ start:308 stop:796 length:489 start_codon:yes stop_codon:yes gene_type:complete